MLELNFDIFLTRTLPISSYSLIASDVVGEFLWFSRVITKYRKKVVLYWGVSKLGDAFLLARSMMDTEFEGRWCF